MKKQRNKITAIILTLAITIIAHPFSIVKAAEATYINYGTLGVFSYQMRNYSSDSSREINIDGTTYYGNTIIDIVLSANKEYDGEFYLVGISGLNLLTSTIYVKGGKIINYGGPGSGNGRFQISFTNTKEIRIIIVNNSYYSQSTFPTLTGLSTTEPTNISSTINDIDIILGDIYNEISNLSFSEATITDITVTAKNSSLQTTFNESLSNYDSNKYSKTFTPNIDINSISVDFISSNYTNANYGVYQFFFFTQDDYNSSFDTNSYTIAVIDFTGYYRYLSNDQHFDYIYSQSMSDDPLDPKSIYLITLYIPLYIFNNGSNFYIQLQNLNLSEVRQFEFNYIGVVESLPGEVSDNHSDSTINDINNVTNDLNQQIQDSNQAQQSIDTMVDDFNLNFDLDSYRFTFDDDFITYFKLKLTDLYNIQELRPFYIIPIVLFILWRLLSG